MRILLICSFTLLVSGCALPVSVQIASFAATGFSYMTTGKGISDHAVSAVAEQDCAIHRIALGEEICSETDDKGSVVVENSPATVAPAVDQSADRLRDSMIKLAKSTDTNQQTARLAASQPPANNALAAIADTLNNLSGRGEIESSGKHPQNGYLVIGHYQEFTAAEKIRTEHAALGTKIRMVLREGTLLYKVTAGPFNKNDAQDIEASISKSALSTRIASLCQSHPCDATVLKLTAQISNKLN